MKSGTNQCIELRENQLALLRLLIAGMKETQEAIAEMDYVGLQQLLQEQTNICAELKFLQRELRDMDTQLGYSSQPGKNSKETETLDEMLPQQAACLRRLISETQVTESELGHLSRVHTAVLQHSRRSINVLMNVLSSCSARYQPHQSRGQACYPIPFEGD